MVDTVRRKKIRTETAEHWGAAARLRDKIKDVPSKELLLPTLHLLDVVNNLFLHSVSQDRTAEQETWWLDRTEDVLHIAVKMLHEITEQIEKYGGPEKVQTIYPR